MNLTGPSNPIDPYRALHKTGMNKGKTALQVFTIEDGDADAIFLEKIPADLFQARLGGAIPKLRLMI